MKRALLFVFVLLLALGGYFWYRGDAQTWVASAKNALFPPNKEGSLTPAAGSENEAAIKPAVATLSYRSALSELKAPLAEDRVRAWEELSE